MQLKINKYAEQEFVGRETIDLINKELERLLKSYNSVLSQETLEMVSVFVTPEFSEKLHACFMKAVSGNLFIE